MPPQRSKPAQPNQSLIDGLACLQALTELAHPVGSRELGRALDLEPTRVNRLLGTLAYLGLAQQDERRKYSPGPAVHVLAAQSLRGSGLIQRSVVPLDSLHDLGFTVALGVLWLDQVCYLYHAQPGDNPGRALGREPMFPAASSGLGHVLLSHLPDAQVRLLYAEAPHHQTRITSNASSDAVGSAAVAGSQDELSELLRNLNSVRRLGHALISTSPASRERTLAVALDHRFAAAIGVAGDFSDDQVSELLRRLRATAAEIALNPADGPDGAQV